MTNIQIEQIAKQYFDVETLAAQGSDHLDFREVAVWNIKAALEAAYILGKKDSNK